MVSSWLLKFVIGLKRERGPREMAVVRDNLSQFRTCDLILVLFYDGVSVSDEG